jgi:hypothetical protein
MQSKLFAAAAVATGAAALKLEAPTNTLAQSIAQECHGTYAYQCIEEKVEKTLSTMSGRVQEQKESCIVTADDLREDIVEGVQAMRADLEKNLLWDMREALTEALNARLDQAQEAIEAAAATANAHMRAEADARIHDTSDISALRIRAQNDIKKLYYRDGNGEEQAETLKAQIRERMDEFAESYEGAAFEDFADAEIGAAEAIIASECDAMDSMINDSLAQWNEAAANATNALDAEIQASLDNMDAVIADKTAAINAVIDELTEDYIVIFWNTIEEIYQEVSFYERQGLIWKALYGKDAFITEVSGIRDWLLSGLAEIRGQLAGELGDERSGFAANVNENRDGFFSDTQDMRAELAATKAEARASMEATETELLDLLNGKGKNDEDGNLRSFVYDLASIGYSPKGFGHHHADGYQPYARWVANSIQEQIDVFGDDAAALW